MKAHATWFVRPLLAASAAVVACSLVQGAAATAEAAAVPLMTIKIYNNSPNFNIYPVLSTGSSTEDKWLQSAFKIPRAKLKDNPFPKPNQFRIYINPTGDGIPPHQSVTLTLPLYSALVPKSQVDPKKPDQYIDWWGGGRVEIFDAPASLHRPPVALTKNYTSRPGQVPVKPIATAALPVCDACQPLKIFKDPAGLKDNEPNQLTEYTLGALNLNKDPIGLNEHNVDFDVSYVDTAYLPAAMEPVNNLQVGYVGTVNSVGTFRAAMRRFVAPDSPFAGWPQMVDNQGRTILKIPSPLHLFGGQMEVTPPPWPPIEKMKQNFRDCAKPGDTRMICDLIRDVRKLFIKNYNNYTAQFPKFPSCDKNIGPVPLNEKTLLQHVYGWGPFNENCNSATFNLLENTPGYAADSHHEYHVVKDKFDDLQYLKTGEFDPYVLLIHGEDYIKAPNVYAYSVDDAVGNMQADGDGFIIAVGGAHGLPNGRPATPPIHINFGFAQTDAVRFVKYGVCTASPNQKVDPDFASFIVSIETISTCPISFVDNGGFLYRFRIKSQPPYPATNRLTPEGHARIDCSGNTNLKGIVWCNNVFAYTVQGPKRDTSFIIAPAPQQPPLAGTAAR